MQVEIPDKLHEDIATRVEASNFDSVESYVLFVLREVVKEHPELDRDTGRDRDRDESVRENLESLGYLEE